MSRDDENLTNRLLRNHSTIENIRKEIEGRTTICEKVSTAIDLNIFTHSGGRGFKTSSAIQYMFASQQAGIPRLRQNRGRNSKCDLRHPACPAEKAFPQPAQSTTRSLGVA